jgi:hypothetical protein
MGQESGQDTEVKGKKGQTVYIVGRRFLMALM